MTQFKNTISCNAYSKVGIADYKINVNQEGLVTLGLGSCVGICIFDIHKRVGGLAHVMLPDSPSDNDSEKSKLKYTQYTLPKMIDEMIALGCSKMNMRAVLVGGGNMFLNTKITLENSIGYRNLQSVQQILNQYSIPVVAQDVGGNVGKTVYFDLDEGDVYVKIGLDIYKLYGKKEDKN